MISEWIALALSLPATTYGWGESMCGDVGQPIECSAGAITASGEPFLPDLPTAAVPMPFHIRAKSVVIWLRDEKGACRSVTVNDKKNPRYIGSGGLDLSRGAIEMLYPSRASATWSGKVELCAVYFSEESRSI